MNLQGADIESLTGVVNKKAWFRAVKPRVTPEMRFLYKML
jgi:hypothetical protein